MFDNIINNETDRIFEELPIIIDSISFNRVNTLRIDDFYKNFFKQELIWRIYGNFTELKNHKNFSFDINDFESYFQDYSSAFLNNAVIGTDEFNELISLAAKYRLHFLCKPLETLINFIYVDCYSKPLIDLFIKTNFFLEYSFILEAYNEFLIVNNFYNYSHQIVFKIDFEKQIKHYIKKYFSRIDSNHFYEIITPLFKFFSFNHEVLSAPVIALAMFLNDCGLKEFSDYLYNNFEPEEYLNIGQFRELLSESKNTEDTSNDLTIPYDENQIEIKNNVIKSEQLSDTKPVQELENENEIENLKDNDVIQLSYFDEYNDDKSEDNKSENFEKSEMLNSNETEPKEFDDVKIDLIKKLKLTNGIEEKIRLLDINQITEKIYDDESKIIPQSINFDLKYSIRKAVNDIYKSMK